MATTGSGRADAQHDSSYDEAAMVIGVAVPLPEPQATQLQDARRRFGDPMADLIRTHITLSGPQEVAARTLPTVEAHLADVAHRHAPYRVVLAGTDTFRPQTQVVFLRVADGAETCRALAADVQGGPLAAPSAYPYHPHVTVAHDVDPAQLDAAQSELAGYRLAFDVRALSLYVRAADGHWNPLRSFDLGRTGR